MNLVELLAERGVPTRVERQGWIQIQTCPQCRRPYYLGYNIRGGYFNCWKCGRLNYGETLGALLDIRVGEALTLARTLDRPRQRQTEKPRGTLRLPRGRGPLGKPHRRYLRDRGFDPNELVRLWELEGIGLAATLKWRIFIPIYRHNKMVSWTARSIGKNPGGLRYVSAALQDEAFPHKEWLYGLDYCRYSIVVCEGPFDAMAIGPGAVATLGVSYTRAQLNLMARYPIRAICFDNEPGAQRRARQLMEDLAVFPGTTCNIVLDAHDAATAKKRDIEIIRKEFLE